MRASMRGSVWFLVVVFALLGLAIGLRFARPPLVYRRSVPEDESVGKSGEGFHALHVGNVAVGDFCGTVALAVLFALVSNGPFVFWLCLVLLVGEVMHFAFGVRSATYEWLFGNEQGLIRGTNSTVEIPYA